MKSQGDERREDSPSQFELTLVAAILKAGHEKDLGTPDNYSDAKDALDLWRQCGRVLTESPESPQSEEKSLRQRRPGENPRVQAMLKHNTFSERAGKGAAGRWGRSRREAERMLKLPSVYPSDFSTLLRHALPETPYREDRERLFQEWSENCRRTERGRIENLKKVGFGEKDFRILAVRILAWYLEHKKAESGSSADD